MERKVEINKEAQQDLEKLEWTWPKRMSWEENDDEEVSFFYLFCFVFYFLFTLFKHTSVKVYIVFFFHYHTTVFDSEYESNIN